MVFMELSRLSPAMILLAIGAALSTATALMHQLERDRAQGRDGSERLTLGHASISRRCVGNSHPRSDRNPRKGWLPYE